MLSIKTFRGNQQCMWSCHYPESQPHHHFLPSGIPLHPQGSQLPHQCLQYGFPHLPEYRPHPRCLRSGTPLHQGNQHPQVDGTLVQMGTMMMTTLNLPTGAREGGSHHRPQMTTRNPLRPRNRDRTQISVRL